MINPDALTVKKANSLIRDETKNLSYCFPNNFMGYCAQDYIEFLLDELLTEIEIYQQDYNSVGRLWRKYI